MYYYSTIRLILIYRPSEGGSRVDLRTAVSVQPMPKAAYRSDFREKHKLSAARFDPGTSRAAGARPLRVRPTKCLERRVFLKMNRKLVSA